MCVELSLVTSFALMELERMQINVTEKRDNLPAWGINVCLSFAFRRHTSVVPLTLIEGQDAWTAADFPNLEHHMLHLAPNHVEELDAAVEAVLASGKRLQVRKACIDMHLRERAGIPCASSLSYRFGS